MKTLRLFVASLFAVALLLAGLAVVAGWGSWETVRAEAAAAGWRFDPGWVSLALGCGVAALLVIARVWAWVFRQAGGRAPASEAAAAWLGSNLGRYLPGKLWQLTWIAAYMRSRDASGAAGLASSLALQAVALATGSAVAIAFLGREAFQGAGVWTLGLAALAVGLALHPAIIRRLVGLGARWLREPPPDRAISAGDLTRAAAGSLAAWGFNGLGFWALTRGVLPDLALGPGTAAGVFAGGYVIGYLVLIAPGGLVAREGAIAALLSSVAGLPLGVAAALAIVARLWTTAAELVAFGVAAGIGLRGRGKAGTR